jgi:hypothetical protein
MSRASRVFGLCLAAGFAGVSLVAACGARTGLVPLEAVDATRHAGDATEESPFDAPAIHEAHPLDVKVECDTPTYCGSDPNYIYKCDKKIYQCSSLDQCFEPCGEAGPGDACAAECVNPCLHTLGQNTSNGCEFYAVEMDGVPTSVGACYAVFVVNQWQTGQHALLEVDYGGKTYDEKELEGFARIPKGTGTKIDYTPFSASAGLAQNEVAILFLSRDPNALLDETSTDPRRLASCPPGVMPAEPRDAAIHGTGVGEAFHIRSNVPIVAYQMLPYGGGHARITGATLLLPINVWGKDYVAANAYSYPSALYQADGAPMFDSERAGPSMAIIAQKDDTHVTIDPVAAIVAGGGLAGTSAGEPVTYTVQKGQYIQLTQIAELTGSAIQADKPIAVIGGSTLMDIPTTAPGNYRADHAEQMLPPVEALGSEYVAVRYRSRNAPLEESVPWRIVASVAGTIFTYDPAPPSPDAPTSLDQGQFKEFWAPGPFVVKSQDSAHPFYVAQYMTGGTHLPYVAIAEAGADAGVDASSLLWGQGDPEFVNVVAPAQYLPSYTFFTDPTYPETNLVVVAAKDVATGQFPDVTLDCAGMLSGWQPVGTAGNYQFTRIDLSTGNYKGQNGCDNGVHTIQATLASEAAPPGDAPLIGVTIWGWGSQATHTDVPPSAANEGDPDFSCWVSYGYPAGANVKKLNRVFVPAK